MSADLADRVAIVTGAGSGIGRATALALARAGARIAIVDIDGGAGETTRKAVCATGQDARAMRADVASARDISAVVEQVGATWGRLDILVNNASLDSIGRDAQVTELEEDTWDAIHAVTLRGTFLCCKHAIPVMARGGGGAIVNVASVAGLVATAGRDAYTAAKGGLIAMTRSLALEYGPAGIRVNAVCPGAVLTPRTAALFADPERRARSAREHSFLGRIAEAEDVADAIVYLTSPAARFVTGAILPVDGGWTAQ
jgi:NAD(P)-dependent dehydrogenase (short-subunit alcohol dehydrogenase family)